MWCKLIDNFFYSESNNMQLKKTSTVAKKGVK